MIQKLINTKCYYPLEKGNFFINDNADKNEPIFTSENEVWSLQILNQSENTLHFVQNDNCIMTQNDLKKCDWVCFTSTTFYFIEAKNVKSGRRKNQRNDAVEKFMITIPYYLNSYNELKNMNLVVVMNFRNVSKITNASNKAKASYFKETFNAKYLETNFLEF